MLLLNFHLSITLIFCNRYGNGATIFTRSGVAARKFQTEIEAGQVGCCTFALERKLTDDRSYGFEPIFICQPNTACFPWLYSLYHKINIVKYIFDPYNIEKKC
jgi:hypothetical protein